MDWQSPVAAGIAAVCAVWMVWQIIRPFTTGTPTACGGCTFCGVDDVGADQNNRSDGLLQVDPL